MAANTNFDMISASTRKYWTQNKFEDAVFDGVPTLKILKARGQNKTWDGGEKIVIPLMEGGNSTTQWQGAWDELDTTPQDDWGAAEFQPKLLTGTCVMSEVDQWKNSGPHQVINLWKSNMERTISQLQDDFNTALHNDGTDAQQIVGLQLAIDSGGTYGNILRTNNSFWQSYEEGTAGVLSEGDMSTAIRTASRSKAKFSDYLIITTLTLFQKYESLILPSFRTQDLKTADLGIPNLQYMGAPMIWDDDCPSGVMYFVHIPSFELHVKRDKNFAWSDKRQPTKQLVDVMHAVWFGALTNKNCRMSGKLTGRTAA